MLRLTQGAPIEPCCRLAANVSVSAWGRQRWAAQLTIDSLAGPALMAFEARSRFLLSMPSLLPAIGICSAVTALDPSKTTDFEAAFLEVQPLCDEFFLPNSMARPTGFDREGHLRHIDAWTRAGEYAQSVTWSTIKVL
jgi:hypothetical protein